MFGPHRGQGERGQLLPFLGIGIVALVGMVSLAVDVGYWRYQQRLQQSAADSAAIAGAIRLYYPTTRSGGTAPVEVTAAAQGASSSNGFTDDAGVGNLTVTVNSPPLASPTSYPSNTAVEVIVSKKQPVFFSAIFGKPSEAVGARAVAVMKSRAGPCLYQLDASGSLSLNAGTVDAVNCGIIYNGTIPGGTVTATSLSYSSSAPGASLTPPLVARQSLPATDPCLTIPGCAYLQNTALPPAGSAIDASGGGSLGAGTYKNCCAGATLTGGIYYVYGGFSGAFSGTGVTIVNADGSDITINGGGRGSMNITAPSSGPSAGVAYYQAPTVANTYTANGNPGFFGGLFYAPKMTYTTHGKQDTFSFLVIGGIALTGNKTLTVDPSLTTPAIGVAAETLRVGLSE